MHTDIAYMTADGPNRLIELAHLVALGVVRLQTATPKCSMGFSESEIPCLAISEETLLIGVTEVNPSTLSQRNDV